MVCPASAPLIMTRVCRYWKELALSVPGLWANFSAQPECDHDIALMTSWLRLSGSYALSIFLRVDCADGIAASALDLIMQYKTRWKHVTLDWQLDDVVPRFLTSDGVVAPPVRLPLLESFVIQTSFDIDMGELDNEVATHLDSLLVEAPRLRQFHWDALQFYTDMDPAQFTLAHFTSLTDLKLACLLSMDDCIEILGRTPLLESCSFNYVRMESLIPHVSLLTPAPSEGELLVLPRLHSLFIDTDCDISPFFNALTLPALRRVAIDFCHNIGDLDSPYLQDDFHDWPQTVFMNFLHRSQCKIEALSLCLPIFERDLGRLLKWCAGTLERVNITGKVDWDLVHEPTLRLLTHRLDHGKAVFPVLSHIRLYDCILHPLPPLALADMVHSHFSRPGGVNISISIRPELLEAVDEKRLAAIQTQCGKGKVLVVETLFKPARVR